MNELEKTTAEEVKAAVTPEAAPAADATPEIAAACAAAATEECAERQSPAEAISEATDAIEGEAAACGVAEPACGEQESPAEMISEATDAIEGEGAAEGNASEACASETPCAEEESPAEAISEATDAIEGEEVADGQADGSRMRRYHKMSKEELADALREIVANKDVAAYKDVNAIKQSFYIIVNRENEEAILRFVENGGNPSDFSAEVNPLETEVKDLLASFREMRTEYLHEEETRKQTNLERRNDLLAEMRKIADDIDNVNLNVNRFKELQQQFRDIKDIPDGAVNDSWKNFQTVGEQFYDSLKVNKSLRDLDFKKNLEAKEEIVKEALSLADDADVIHAFRTLQALHARWREIGPVAKEHREEIWNRFKEASTAVNKRHQEYFEGRKAAEQEAEARKIALCERVEAIDMDSINSFARWDEVTKEIIAIQAEWKEAGVAARKANNQLFARFRKTCDEFFSRKTEYFRNTKQTHAENLEKKIALCEKAEALADMEDFKAQGDAVKALQAEWRTVGPVARKHSDEVWERFNKALSVYFDRRRRRSSDQRKEEAANLEAKQAVIARLSEINPETDDRKEALISLRDLQKEWQQIGHVPFKLKQKVNDEYRKVCDQLYEALNVSRRAERLNNYRDQVSNMDDDKMPRERRNLLRAIENKRAELKTVENNLGFFKNVKTSAGNTMLRDVNRQIDRIKEEIATLEKKIELLDSKETSSEE